jgi:hypothetical protein
MIYQLARNVPVIRSNPGVETALRYQKSLNNNSFVRAGLFQAAFGRLPAKAPHATIICSICLFP